MKNPTIGPPKQGADGQWYFSCQGKNGRTVFPSEGYPTKAHAQRAIKRLPAIVAAATLVLK